jgi:hypothetical protein
LQRQALSAVDLVAIVLLACVAWASDYRELPYPLELVDSFFERNPALINALGLGVDVDRFVLRR